MSADRTLMGAPADLGAELTPAGLGGRLDDLPRLAALLRSAARADLAACLGAAGGALTGTAMVWADAGPQQCTAVAGVLLGGGRVAGDGGEPGTVRLRQGRTGPALDGATGPVAGARGADLLVVTAHTDAPGVRRSVLVDLRSAPPTRVVHLPRVPTVGLRATELSPVEFRGLAVPEEAVLGEVPAAGRPVARLLPSAVIPYAAVGTLDSLLRIATRFAADRRLGGRAVADLPYTRRILADAFADLLVCDCACTAAVRALHAPRGCAAAHLAAVGMLARRRLADAAHRLSVLLGATFYLREGPHGRFQKHLRDLRQAVLGGASLADRALAALPATGAAGPHPVPASVYALDAALPPLRLDAPVAPDDDTWLVPALDSVRDPRLRSQVDGLLARVCALRDELAAPAEPALIRLAERYAALVAATACIRVWKANQGVGFLGGTDWVVRALGRLHRDDRRDDPDDRPDPLYEELERRRASGRTLDLADRPLWD